jgi:hypothetical protein
MSRSRRRNQLTPEEKELVRTIERKWLSVARCTDRIDRQQATDAVNAVYFALGIRKEPKIIFADSPHAANEMAEHRDKYTEQLSPDIYMFLRRAFIVRRTDNLIQPPINQRKKPDRSYITPPSDLSGVSVQFWAYEAMSIDLACSVFGCYFLGSEHLNLQQKWEAFQLLVTNCGFISPFQDICFVSDRPTELIFKDDFILHAVDRPAVVFRDGYKMYFENGICLSMSF